VLVHLDMSVTVVPSSSAPGAERQRELTGVVCAKAMRLASRWGLSTVGTIAARVRLEHTRPVSEDFTRRALETLPRLRWLDDAREWFSLTDDASPLHANVHAVLAREPRMELYLLWRAITRSGRNSARHVGVPEAVLRRYLQDIADCEIRGRIVSHRIVAYCRTDSLESCGTQ
jgi:hypothetical protein